MIIPKPRRMSNKEMMNFRIVPIARMTECLRWLCLSKLSINKSWSAEDVAAGLDILRALSNLACISRAAWLLKFESCRSSTSSSSLLCILAGSERFIVLRPESSSLN